MIKYIINPIVSPNRHNSFMELCCETVITVNNKRKVAKTERVGMFNPHYEIGYIRS